MTITTIKDYVAHVESSIAKALRHESGIDVEILSIKGFSTGVQRRLVNNLCRLPKENPVYLEAGLYGGATFCAALNHNPNLHAYGVEDFSQDFGDSGIRAHLEGNIERYKFEAKSVHILNSDFFQLDLRKIRRPIDLYYFDGEHSFESQAKALPHAFDHMADTFLFLVDDYAWQPVKEGTQHSLIDLSDKMTVKKEWVLSDGIPDGPNWHNDVAIFLCEKI